MLRLVLLPPTYLVSKNVPVGLTKIIIIHLLDTVLHKCPFHQIYLIVFLKFSIFYFFHNVFSQFITERGRLKFSATSGYICQFLFEDVSVFLCVKFISFQINLKLS